jgi:hypothetical protein
MGSPQGSLEPGRPGWPVPGRRQATASAALAAAVAVAGRPQIRGCDSERSGVVAPNHVGARGEEWLIAAAVGSRCA